MKINRRFFYIVLLFLTFYIDLLLAQKIQNIDATPQSNSSEPKFCYDYAYSQQGIYFRKDSGGIKSPKIVGSFAIDEELEVKLFIRNLAGTNIEISDMLVDITEINTTQARYVENSTSLAKKLTSKALLDSTHLNVGSESSGDYIKGIEIGELESQDGFYIYYRLNPKQRELNIPIALEAKYSLTVEGEATSSHSLKLNSDVEMCSTPNLPYTPREGIFNVVYSSYYPYTDGNNYYNLPTQIVSREGDFKLVSLDSDDFQTPKGVSTIVAIEMIDASIFYDSDNSCSDLASSITPRVWMIFENAIESLEFNKASLQDAISNQMTTLSSSSEFYSKARQNVAFRVSYNTDNNGSLMKISSDERGYGVKNFSQVIQGLSSCLESVKLQDGTLSNSVADACRDAQNSSMTRAELATCMECIYGNNTRVVCSRDNFAIRPEAFLMHISDQNQTDPLNPLTPRVKLTRLYSGVSQATASRLNLASEYSYILEVNATNHLNNDSSKGYTKSFIEGVLSDRAQYIWQPKSITDLEASTKCNDESNKTVEIRFLDGRAEANISLAQVGEYIFGIVDKRWTAVDSDPALMSHHLNPNFLVGSDCIDGSSETAPLGSSTKSGCIISSKHINTQADLKYNDYELALHPYKYDISNKITLGLTNREINTTDHFSNFVYMADISKPKDINMSIQFHNTITPQGFRGSPLTNFVAGCFAKPIDINISKTDPLNRELSLRYILSHRETGASTISATVPSGTSQDANLSTKEELFLKDERGVLKSIINLNFDRTRDRVANPEEINYSKITLSDATTLFSADLVKNKIAKSSIIVDQNITHYFGRTASKRSRVVCDSFPCLFTTGQKPSLLIFYEIYCHSNTGGNVCNRELIPKLQMQHIQRVDSRWYANLNHQEIGDGELGLISGVAEEFVDISAIGNRNNYTKYLALSYSGGGGVPYRAKMQSSVARWLMFDENSAGEGDIKNKYLILYSSPTKWSGKYESDSTTNTQKIKHTNRRTMW